MIRFSMGSHFLRRHRTSYGFYTRWIFPGDTFINHREFRNLFSNHCHCKSLKLFHRGYASHGNTPWVLLGLFRFCRQKTDPDHRGHVDGAANGVHWSSCLRAIDPSGPIGRYRFALHAAGYRNRTDHIGITDRYRFECNGDRRYGQKASHCHPVDGGQPEAALSNQLVGIPTWHIGRCDCRLRARYDGGGHLHDGWRQHQMAYANHYDSHCIGNQQGTIWNGRRPRPGAFGHCVLR